MDNQQLLALLKLAGETPGVPDTTGPYGRGAGPGLGTGSGLGMLISALTQGQEQPVLQGQSQQAIQGIISYLVANDMLDPRLLAGLGLNVPETQPEKTSAEKEAAWPAWMAKWLGRGGATMARGAANPNMLSGLRGRLSGMFGGGANPAAMSRLNNQKEIERMLMSATRGVRNMPIGRTPIVKNYGVKWVG